jgi:hypothetical protein
MRQTDAPAAPRTIGRRDRRTGLRGTTRSRGTAERIERAPAALLQRSPRGFFRLVATKVVARLESRCGEFAVRAPVTQLASAGTVGTLVYDSEVVQRVGEVSVKRAELCS